MATEETIEFVSGLDLGQANEFTALAVLEKRSQEDKFDRRLAIYSVRHLERFPIGTPYSAIFARVSTLFSSMVLPENTLVVDQTAVGAPVMRSRVRLADTALEVQNRDDFRQARRGGLRH